MAEPDVVIPVRPGERNDELRHALRSIDAHVPHRHVWVSGYAPSWLRGAGTIPAGAQAGSKHANSLRNLVAACKDPRVSEEFLLWNDDFYAMAPVPEGGPPPAHRGPVRERLEALGMSRRSAYYRGLATTAEVLIRLGVEDPLDYELHVPMALTKGLVLRSLVEAAGPGLPRTSAPQIRTLAGNLAGLGGARMEDVKVETPHSPPPPAGAWLSSSDASWGRHPALRAVEEAFPGLCRYEEGWEP